MSKTSAAAAKALTSSNHFELFGLSAAFSVDEDALEKAYREIQSQVHPDRFAHAGDAERRASLQWTTRVNEAFQILKNPVTRAKHILELHGVDVAFETNTQMPTEFLMQQLELREELERAAAKKDPALLEAIRIRLSAQSKDLEKKIREKIDQAEDYKAAAERVRELMFLQKLDAEIDLAYEEIESG
jgi:molecular chaperone HscB